ncbi:MAG: hypothetical protein ACXVW6_05670 [Nocardioidaceae bacterium]
MHPALLDNGTGWLVACAAGLVVVLLAVLLTLVTTGRRRLRRDLDAARTRLDDLGRRVEELTAAPPVTPPAAGPATSTATAPWARPQLEPDYVITSVGDHPAERSGALAVPAAPLTAGQFAGVAVGESLVRVLSLGYGVRRALSAENRNRIAFEVRREIRRSRKQRRREVKEARRHLRATQRAGLSEDAA